MKTLITGHRVQKLTNYNLSKIRDLISEVFANTFLKDTTLGLSGMASGVDLMFCEEMLLRNIPYISCIPFESQDTTMSSENADLRKYFIEKSAETWNIRNSRMVEKADAALVVFDGNKGGTHNVFQQLIENKKPFVWINPVSEKFYEIL